MATNSNSYLAEDEMERGGLGRGRIRDTSNSIKLIRDITYKIIPFCGFSLVIFSVGAILVSTLAFDKPIPHQGTLVVLILLLSFFVLFGIGFTYLYFRKSHAHVGKGSDSTGPSRQDNRRSRHVQGYVQSFAQMPKRISDKISPAVPRRVEGGLIRSDTLRVQAPSPNTYRRETEDHGSIPLQQKEPRELAGSACQQNRRLSQQRKYRTDKRGCPRPSNATRQSKPEASQLLSGGKRNAFIQANTTSTPLYMRSNDCPDTHDTEGNTHGLLSMSDRAQLPPVVPIRRRPVGPGIDTGIPIQRPVRGPRDMPGHGASMQIPNKRVSEYPFPTSPNQERERSEQLSGPALGLHTKSARGWQTNNGGLRRVGRRVSPWPVAPAAGQEMSVEDKRETVNGVLRFYYQGYPETDNRTQYHDIPSVSPRQLPIPAGASVAFARASLEGETQKAENKELSPYLEYDITDYADAFRGLPQPQDQVIGAGSPPINTRSGLHAINTPMSNQDYDSLVSTEVNRKPVHLPGDKLHATRRKFSFETAGTADYVRQNVTNKGRALAGPTPSGAPTPNQGQSFDPRHLSAVPEPLKLVDKNQARGTSHRSDDYNPPSVTISE
ncbi:hypothetical protein GGR58DRAFT_522906 [Xylaria digitata]|nr:hypothetical protein GGR58DRAFT_522906 [Xylaria digitata]